MLDKNGDTCSTLLCKPINRQREQREVAWRRTCQPAKSAIDRSISVRNVNVNRSVGRFPLAAPYPVQYVIHPEDPCHSTHITTGNGEPANEIWRPAVRWCPNLPHALSVGIAGEEELVVPPRPATLAQRTIGRVLELLVLPVELPNGDETFREEHEEAVEHYLVLSSKLVQFEDIVVVVPVIIL